MNRSTLLFRQLFDRETSTYTYVLADSKTRDAILIDPVAEQVERDARLCDELGLRLVYTLETHVHADHITGSGELRLRLGADTVTSTEAQVSCATVVVGDGDVLRFGTYLVEARHTPGHTDGDVTYVVRDGPRTLAFTGDSLLIRGSGRTDFQQGNSRALYRSVHEKIYSLPDDTLIYPGHDYRGHTVSTVGEEKAHNPRLGVTVTEEQFVQMMSALHLPEPRRIAVAIPGKT